MTFAQDDSAKFTSMPHSAIAEGVVDFVLSPKEIATELNWISTHPLINREAKKKEPETEVIPSSEPALDVGPALGDLLRGFMELATFLALMYLAFSQYRQTSPPALSIQVSTPSEKPIMTSDTKNEQIA